MSTALKTSRPEEPPQPPDPRRHPETENRKPTGNRNQNQSASRRDGVQSMCVIPKSLASSSSPSSQGKRRLSDLDIPFIDEEDAWETPEGTHSTIVSSVAVQAELSVLDHINTRFILSNKSNAGLNRSKICCFPFLFIKYFCKITSKPIFYLCFILCVRII